jgi:hypothetical protein
MSLLRRFAHSHGSFPAAGALVAAVATCASRPAEAKLARIVGMELNRIKSEYARTSTPQQQKLALAEISRTPLSRIQGLDAKIVAQLLSTLVSVDAPPNLDITEQCASWLCANVEAATVTGNALAQSLHALKTLQYCSMPMLLDAVSGRIPAALESMTPSSIVMLLDALCETRTVESHGAQILVKVQEIMTEGTVTDAIMLAGALARLPESEDSTYLVRLAVQKFITRAKDGENPVKSAGDIAALVPVLDKLEPESAGALQGLLISALGTLDDAVPLRDAVPLLKSVSHVSPGNPLRETVVRSASALDLSELADDKAVQILFWFSRVAPLTPKLAAVAAKVASRDVLALPYALNHKLLLAMESEPAVEAQQSKFLSLLIDRITKKNNAQTQVEGQEIASVLTKFSVETYFQELQLVVQNAAARWKTHDVIIFLEAASAISTRFARKLMRDSGPLFSGVISTSNSTQLSSIAACYGRARVRNDTLCDAIANRAVVISRELSLQSMCIILTSLAVVDYRTNKAFLELAPVVRLLLPRANASQVANLTGAFSKMMVWNYRLFASLSQRAFELCEDFSVPQIVTVVAGLNRMSMRHDEMFQQLLGRMRGKAASLTVTECVHLLSAFSHGGAWDVIVFDELAAKLVREQQTLTAQLVGESLMAFARVGLQTHRIFQDLSLRALAVAPTCPPIALANIATAYSLAGCRHEELFSVLAERVLQAKDECPAVTIGAILAAFANIGLKNDRLFIEMIPRVRHVAHYGTPKDVANVVMAYASVGLWHYKLFAKLADRAIQLRGECRGVHIAQILSAYAKVEMKYDKLFSEFALRIQTIAHVLSVSEIISIIQSYSKIGLCDTAVFFAVGDRLAGLVGGLEDREAEIVISTFSKANIPHPQLMNSIFERFPKLKSEQENPPASAVSSGSADASSTVLASPQNEQ